MISCPNNNNNSLSLLLFLTKSVPRPFRRQSGLRALKPSQETASEFEGLTNCLSPP